MYFREVAPDFNSTQYDGDHAYLSEFVVDYQKPFRIRNSILPTHTIPLVNADVPGDAYWLLVRLRNTRGRFFFSCNAPGF